MAFYLDNGIRGYTEENGENIGNLVQVLCYSVNKTVKVRCYSKERDPSQQSVDIDQNPRKFLGNAIYVDFTEQVVNNDYQVRVTIPVHTTTGTLTTQITVAGFESFPSEKMLSFDLFKTKLFFVKPEAQGPGSAKDYSAFKDGPLKIENANGVSRYALAKNNPTDKWYLNTQNNNGGVIFEG